MWYVIKIWQQIMGPKCVACLLGIFTLSGKQGSDNSDLDNTHFYT
jgi:hypothetical protein